MGAWLLFLVASSGFEFTEHEDVILPRFRINLRTFLVAVAGIAVCLTLIVRPYLQQRRHIQYLESHGDIDIIVTEQQQLEQLGFPHLAVVFGTATAVHVNVTLLPSKQLRIFGRTVPFERVADELAAIHRIVSDKFTFNSMQIDLCFDSSWKTRDTLRMHFQMIQTVAADPRFDDANYHVTSFPGRPFVLTP